MEDALTLNRSIQQRVMGRLIQLGREMHALEAIRLAMVVSEGKKDAHSSSTSSLCLFASSPFNGSEFARIRKGNWNDLERQKLLNLVSRHGVGGGQWFDAARWGAISAELNNSSPVPFTSLECLQEYVRIRSADVHAFTHREDRFIREACVSIGYKWVELSRQLQETLGVFRSPFQIAERYRLIASAIFQERNLRQRKVWEHIKPFVVFTTDGAVDCDWVCVVSNRAAASTAQPRLPIAPSSIEGAMEYGFKLQLLQEGSPSKSETYWSIYGVLCFLDTPLRRKVPSLFSSASLRYRQLTLDEFAAQAGCSPDEITSKITSEVEKSKGASVVNCERVSSALFGHDRAALIVYEVSVKISQYVREK